MNAPSRVLVTGAGGFIGAAICRALLARGDEVHGMTRRASARDEGVIAHTADLNEPASVRAAFRASMPNAVIHCAAVLPLNRPDPALSEAVNVAGTHAVVEACLEVGCRRLIHISSMSAQPDNRAVYGATKRRSEEVVRGCELNWTIFRPSLVYGRDERSVFAKMVQLARKLPVIPVLGSGREPVRPVHVDDVAAAVLRVLDAPATFGKTYCLGGKDAMTVRDMFRQLAVALGRKPLLVTVPMPIARLLATLMEAVMANPPFTHDNLEGVEKAAPVDIDDAVRDFGFAPRAFGDGLRELFGEPARP